MSARSAKNELGTNLINSSPTVFRVARNELGFVIATPQSETATSSVSRGIQNDFTRSRPTTSLVNLLR